MELAMILNAGGFLICPPYILKYSYGTTPEISGGYQPSAMD
jgi:hypothetical protein